jgi:hypothetical protein
MTLGVLITNYQAWSLTELAIKEVLRCSGERISRIIVVDDASDAPAIFPESAKVFIYRNPQNLGYVRSVNVGMRLMNEDLVLLLDCDAYPIMDLVPGILRHFEGEPGLGALGVLEVGASGKTRIAGEREPTLGYFLLGQALGDRFTRRGWFLGKRFVLHSCCMAVRRSAFEQIGGFDEEFDFLDADNDFSMRLQDAGWRIKADCLLQCFHQGSGSPQTTSQRVIRFYRNRWYLLRKHDRVRFAPVCQLLLGLRHTGELICARFASALRLRPKGELHDKLAGRYQLLRSVFRDYAGE